jgi:hypothetical protein
MKAALFSIEATGERVFEGYTTAEDWNGWERPLFPFESAQQIAEAVSEYQTAFYDEGADEFVFEVEDSDDERFGAVEVETIGKLYPIGAGVWIWERATNAVS